MVDVARIGPWPHSTTPGHPRGTQWHANATFNEVLDWAFRSKADVGYLPYGVHRAAFRHSVSQRHPATTPISADAALAQAMALENVPASWRDGLRYIMNKESGGQVGIKNPAHSARGLFQLTAVNYHLNPNGAASFGNAVEEAQGGIRYIRQRYHTADNAVVHWQQHHWY